MCQYRNQRLYTFFEHQVLPQSPNSNTTHRELRRIIFPSLSTVLYCCKSLDTEAYVSDVGVCVWCVSFARVPTFIHSIITNRFLCKSNSCRCTQCDRSYGVVVARLLTRTRKNAYFCKLSIGCNNTVCRWYAPSI